MKSILDPDFEYTPSVETDIHATFERVWRELDTRDQSTTSPGDDCNSVLLECNGELVDSCSGSFVEGKEPHVYANRRAPDELRRQPLLSLRVADKARRRWLNLSDRARKASQDPPTTQDCRRRAATNCPSSSP
jgi:hypothetical protein